MQLSWNAQRTAAWLLSGDGRRSTPVPVDVCPPEDLHAVHDELLAWDLIAEDKPASGQLVFRMDDKTQRSRSARLTGTYRSNLARWRILEYLATHDSVSSLRELLNDPAASDFSGPLSETELSDAAAFLREQRMILVRGTWEDRLHRPSLTRHGREALEAGKLAPDSPNQSGASTSRYDTTIIGNVATFQQGDHNTVETVTQNNAPPAFYENLDQLRSTLHAHASLDDDTRQYAQDALDHIENDARAGKPPGILRLAVNALATTVGTAAGTEFVELATQAAHQLPGA